MFCRSSVEVLHKFTVLIWLLFRQRSFYDSVSVTLSHELFKVVSPSTLPTVWSNRSYCCCFFLDTSALVTVLGHVAVKSPQCIGRLLVCRFQHSGFVPKVDVVWLKISFFLNMFFRCNILHCIILASNTTDFCHCPALCNWFDQRWKLQVTGSAVRARSDGIRITASPLSSHSHLFVAPTHVYCARHFSLGCSQADSETGTLGKCLFFFRKPKLYTVEKDKFSQN